MEFKEALKEILKIKGISALEDQSTLKLLEDYGAFDEYSVFRSIMENIVAMKAGKMLQNTFYYSVEDKGQAWTQMKSKLIERLPYDEVFLNLFFDDMEYAFMGYAYEKGSYDRDINSDVEEMLGQVWTDDRGVKYSADKKRLINASEIGGTYIVNPETEYIDSYAFQQNSKIERVILPKELKKIGSHAFQICPYLNKMEFQDGVSEIGECAFGGCALKEVYLPNELHRISDALFSTCTNLLYVHIPKNVTSIGACAFSDCHSLQYVVIPDNVSTIGDLAFYWCKSLYYVVLPAKLTSVGENIFDNCKSLRYIGIPKGTISKFTLLMPQYANLFVEYEQTQSYDKMNFIYKETQSIKTNVCNEELSSEVTAEDFANAWTDEFGVKYSADRKRLLKAPKSIVNYSIKTGTKVICDKAFYFIRSLKRIFIPDSVILIGKQVFEDCSYLESIEVDIQNLFYDSRNNCNAVIETSSNTLLYGCSSTIVSNSISTIGNNAFYGCFNLKEIELPNSIAHIGAKAFMKCMSLTKVIIPESVTRIESWTFFNCTSLKEVVIPPSVIKICYRSFGSCESLTHIDIPNTVIEIGDSAFYNCKSLVKIVIPNSVTQIENNAFYGCCSLSDIFIPDSVVKIGEYAFCECISLSSILIPNSVTIIENCTFNGCNSLIQVVMPNSISQIGDNAFYDCSSLKELTISDSVSEIGDMAFGGCDSLTQISFSGIVSRIGSDIFNGCESLKQILIPAGNMSHYEKLLLDYKDILNEQGSYRHESNMDNSIGSQLFAHLGKAFNTKVNPTKHILLLQNLLNNSLFTFKHPSDKSALPSFMWNEEGLSLGYDLVLPYTIPFLWIRTLAKRDVEKFDEVIDLLHKEFGVEVSEKIDVANIVQGIKQYGFSEFKPNFDVQVNKSIISKFYGDCLCLENFILFFGSNIDMSDILPSQSKEVYLSAASYSLNKIICEMVDDFKQGNIDGN